MSEIYQTICNEGPQAYQSMIFEYKVNQCPSNKEGTQCPNGASCLGYHSTSDRRRRVFDEVTHHLRYDYHLCPVLTSQSHCPDGDLCRYAHNKYEINFHPFIYKLYKCENPLCHQDPKIQSCCPGCHSTSEKAPQKIFNHAKLFLQRQDHDDLRSPAIRPHRVQLDLTTFKTEPCEIKTSHNFKECIYYHSNKKDRRRDLTKIRYYPEPCINGGPNGCDNEYCMFAHNKTEEFYHPLKFKTKYCKYLIHDINRCDYGQYCSFAHADSEITIDLIHCKTKDNAFHVYDYKTVFCPFVYEHTRSDCVYAHNPQDFRRDPIDEPNIIPEQCEHWTRDDRIIAYEMGGCPRGLKCNKCHGWKEYEFHPQIFKTRLCSNGTNCHKDACPFYHSAEDKREQFNPIQPPLDRRIGRKRIGYLPFTSPKGFVPSPVNKRMAHYNNTNSGNKSPLLQGPQSPTLNGMSPNKNTNQPVSSFTSAFKFKLQGTQPQMFSPQQSYEERKITSDKKPPGALKPRSEYGEARSPSDLTGNIWNSYNSTYMNQEFSEDGDRARSLNENQMMTAMNGVKGPHQGGNGFYIKTKFAPHELGGGFDGGFSMLGTAYNGTGAPNYISEHQPISFGGQQGYQGSPSKQGGHIQSFMNGSPSKKMTKTAPQQMQQVDSKASTGVDKEFADIQKILEDQ